MKDKRCKEDRKSGKYRYVDIMSVLSLVFTFLATERQRKGRETTE